MSEHPEAGESRRSSRRWSSAGFSLAEVAIVLACASILMAASLPNLNRLHQEWALWGSARLLESSLQWGRAHAVSANTSMVFTVADEGRGFYWLDGYSGEKYERSHCILPGDVRISSSPRKPLRFYQHGNAVPAGTFVVEGRTGQYRVIVNPGGRIRVQRN